MLVLATFCALTLGETAKAEALAIVNPGFEQAEGQLPAGWMYDAWEPGKTGCTGFVIDDAYSGARAAVIENLGFNDARFEQVISVEPNSYYRFSAMAKAEGCMADNVGANISILGVLEMSNQIRDTGGEWQKLVFYGMTGPSQREVTLLLRVGGYGSLNTGRAWFDDVQVEKLDDAPVGADVASLVAAPLGHGDEDDTDGESGFHVQGDERPFTPLILLVAAVFAVAFFAVYNQLERGLKPAGPMGMQKPLLWCLLGALALRAMLAVMVEGYSVDIGCWRGWSQRMIEVGPFAFYTEGFCDYPPGYMLALGALGVIRMAFGLDLTGNAFLLILKLPAIACDLLTAYYLYRVIGKRLGEAVGFVCAVLFAFCPAILVNSAAWGQIDSILTLLLVLSVDAMTEKKMMKASLIFCAALLSKPQALIFAPLLLFGFIEEIVDSPKEGLRCLGKCALAAGGLFVAVILPFSYGQSPVWIIEKYLSTMSSYGYASVNAFNLFAILGGNWIEQTDIPFLFSWQVWGTIGMVLALAYATLLWVLASDKRKALPVVGAVFVCGMFMLGVRMHERYMYPAFALILLAYAYWKDKRFLLCFGVLSVPHFVNVALALQSMHILKPDEVWMRIFTVVNLAGFGFLCFVAWSALVAGKPAVVVVGEPPVQESEPIPDSVVEPVQESAEPVLTRPVPVVEPPFTLPTLRKAGRGEKVSMKRTDILWMLGLTLVYAAIAFFHLGDTKAPQSLYESAAVGQTVTVDFGSPQDIDRMMYYGGVTRSAVGLDVSFSDDNVTWSRPVRVTYEENTMFMWHRVDLLREARFARVSFLDFGLPMFEIGFQNARAELLQPLAIEQSEGGVSRVTSDASRLFDEQELVPVRPDAMNSMYFDEIYHARTAYEHNHNIEWYETTHPPLGKVFISWAVSLFGMTPFGWRFAGALAGVLMVPAMYFLAHLLFRKRFLTISVTALLTFDLMHFSQTRLATIDSYPVLFIILAFAFMALYMMRSMHRDSLWSTLWPLAGSGVCMGLGIASKWIVIYAGAGLAVMFAWTLVMRHMEWMRRSGDADDGELPLYVGQYPKRAMLTLAWCALFFVVIPMLIYVGSYYQYFRIAGQGHDLAGVWRAQVSMFDYHSTLEATHDFSSPWWQWPLMLRPMFYFMGEGLPVGVVESINGMGNPAVWWPGFAALIWVIWRIVKGGGKRDQRLWLVIAGFAAQFLPWVLVTRCTFIYHYFASLPFVILCIGLFLETVLEADPVHGKKAVIGYIAVVVIVFALFYPVVAAIPVPLEYARFLRWLPSWVLFGG